jgi:hypothetical protein
VQRFQQQFRDDGARAREAMASAACRAAVGAIATRTPVGRPGHAAHTAAVSTSRALPQMPSTVIKAGRLSIRLGHGDLAKAVDRASHGRPRYWRVHQLEQHLVWQSTSHPPSCLRVPADRFDQAMTDLHRSRHRQRALQQVSGEDVGQQFVDLSARARNLRAQSRALIRLMNQAVTVSDTIKIQNELFRHPGPDRGAGGPVALPARPGGHVDHHDAARPAGRRASPPRTRHGDRQRASPQLAARHRTSSRR